MRALRVLSGLVVLVLLGVAGALVAARLWPTQPLRQVQLVAFAPYAAVCLVVALVLAVLLWFRSSRRPPLELAVLLCLVGLLFQGWWLAPRFVGPHTEGPTRLRVLTLNERMGRGDAAETVRLVRSWEPDVLVLTEVTPQLAARLRAAGLDRLLAHRAGRPADGARGTVVFSDRPLTRRQRVPMSNTGLVVRVGGPRPFMLVAVHTASPAARIGLWRRDQARLRRLPRQVGGPLIMAGDFNATVDHLAMRRLLDTGLADAAAQARSGWQPTWPAAASVGHGVPGGVSLVAIDHVLASAPYAATATFTAAVPGTDHRALLAWLTVRPPSD